MSGLSRNSDGERCKEISTPTRTFQFAGIASKVGGFSAWIGIGEAIGLGMKLAIPQLPLDHGATGHIVAGLLLSLDLLGLLPHRRTLKRCLLHANDLYRSGMISEAEWREMRVECIKRH